MKTTQQTLSVIATRAVDSFTNYRAAIMAVAASGKAGQIVDGADGLDTLWGEMETAMHELYESLNPPKGKNDDHFFMKSELYEQCHICKGTLKIDMGDTKYKGNPCPQCASPGYDTPGYMQIGMTVGQLERIRAEQQLLLSLVVRLADLTFTEPMAVECLKHHVEEAKDAVKRVNKSDVLAARYLDDKARRKKS